MPQLEVDKTFVVSKLTTAIYLFLYNHPISICMLSLIDEAYDVNSRRQTFHECNEGLRSMTVKYLE